VSGRPFSSAQFTEPWRITVESNKKKHCEIAKRCPENIALVVKCVKLFVPKLLRK
jgi:hypothetical protein